MHSLCHFQFYEPNIRKLLSCINLVILRAIEGIKRGIDQRFSDHP